MDLVYTLLGIISTLFSQRFGLLEAFLTASVLHSVLPEEGLKQAETLTEECADANCCA